MRWIAALAAAAVLAAAPGAFRGDAGRAQVAIVFDGAGASLAALAPVYGMRRPFGLGIVPRLAYSAEISKEAPAHGLEAIVELPPALSPAAADSSRGGSPGTRGGPIRDAALDDLFSVPGAVGAAWQAGGPAAADPAAARAVLEAVRARGLWFLEEDRGARSAIPEAARALGVPLLEAAGRLDAPPAPDAIAARARELIAQARDSGSAIAVAGLQTGAPRVVGRLLGEFERAGVALVPPSALLR